MPKQELDYNKGISGRFKIRRVVFYASDSYYGIYDVLPEELDPDSPTPVYNTYNGITFTGELVKPKQGDIIECTTAYTVHEKYGPQYVISSVKMDLDMNDPESKRLYLESIFSPMDVMHMYDALSDPFQALMDKDRDALVRVRGFGNKSVDKKIANFHAKLGISRLITELSAFDLTMGACSKLLDVYGNPDVVIQVIKDNPYRLIRDVDGIGWKKADMLAMKAGMNPHDIKRVIALMYYYMDSRGNDGDSWITPEELQGAIFEYLGDDIPGTVVTDAIHEMQDKNDIWCNDEHTKIGLYKYYRIEKALAENLIRLRDSENDFEYSDWEESIKRQEELQGWEFEPEQIEGIKACLDNNVVYITGGAGTGKSSTVGGMLAAFKGKYTFTQCALAGRAASRLAEITGNEGSTIHRLLGAKGPGEFEHTSENPIDYDIVIVDEVSMIGVDLMLRLTDAMRNGTKLIMLGDSNQLEAIGAGNFAHDILNSDEICTIKLTKIHRQAQKSGIVTQSMRVSGGAQITEKDYVGKTTRGELCDFHIDAYEDKSHTFYAIMEHATVLLENGIPKEDIEVIVPMKDRGDASVYNLNLSLQDLLNPKNDSNCDLIPNQEVTSLIGKDKSYTFRIGDRVINRVNNYDTDPNIFNGNIGEVIELRGRSHSYPMTVYFYGIGNVDIPRSAINNIHLAYAITCHSAQGSEFKNVIVGVDFNSFPLLTRQWIYTAITRAKKDCILCCQNSALRYAIMQNFVSEKRTHLLDLLKKETEVVY